jgi:hypothetical protein
VLSLATALTAAVATPARAQETAHPAAVAASAPPSISSLTGAEGAGWIAVPAPTLISPSLIAPRISLAHRWWFWASLGAAAVAVLIAGFVLKPGQPYSGNATPGVDPLP